MPIVVVGVVHPLPSRDRPFGNAREGREEQPSPMVEKLVMECPPYMREDEESRLLPWGSFLLVLDLCYALGEGGLTTITNGRKISEGESTIYTT